MATYAIADVMSTWFDLPKDISFSFFEQEQLETLQLSSEYDFLITEMNSNLVLLECVSGLRKSKYISHQIDIDMFVNQQVSSFPASKKSIFSQALGRKTQSIIDATGGWLGDTLRMCSQNYQVNVFERHWLLQGFATYACEKLAKTEWAIKNQAPIPKIHKLDAIDALQNNDLKADCVYIDPMFPPKRKKSAVVRKSMNILHQIVGQDHDAEQLFAAAYDSGATRIVVKRPDYSEPLGAKLVTPSETLSGKLVRYDVYLR